MRDRLAARAVLDAAPLQGPARKPFTPDYDDDMFARRRAAMARRTLVNA